VGYEVTKGNIVTW